MTDQLNKETNEFKLDYNLKITEIFELKEKISGKHSINIDLAKKWMDSQLSERRKIACLNLINNTYYITMNDLFDSISVLVDKVYRSINLNKNIYIWAGQKSGSSYFIALIAYHYIRLKRYKEPLVFINFTDSILQVINQSELLIFDDCTYSGNQTIKIISEMKDLKIKTYFCYAIMSQKSIDKINKLGEDKVIQIDEDETEIVKGIDISWLTLICTSTIPLLKDSITNYSELIDLYYYFCLILNGGTPPISLYFDYKIADYVSTFAKPLMIGPIMPKKLHYYDKKDDENFDYESDIYFFVSDILKYNEINWTEDQINDYIKNMIIDENNISTVQILYYHVHLLMDVIKPILFLQI